MSNDNTENLQRNAAIGSMDELLALSLDDLDDLPSFDCPPPGVYIVKVSTEQKDVKDSQAIEAGYTIVEPVELKDTNSTPPVAGSKFSTLFMLNPYGIGKLKEFCAPFGKHFGTGSVRELVMDHIKEVTCVVIVGNRKDKNDPEKIYPTVKVSSIA
jgi:hypothetical protein